MPRSIGQVVHQVSSSFRRVVGYNPTSHIDPNDPPPDPEEDEGGSSGVFVSENFDSGSLPDEGFYDSGFLWGNSSGTVSVTTSQSYSGSHSMRLRLPSGTDGRAEQRFTVGAVARTELWTVFRLRIPSNWEHGEEGSESSLNRIFSLWMDAFGSEGPTGVIAVANGGSGESVLHPYVYDRDAVQQPVNETSFVFARTPDDQGRWMEIAVRARMAVSEDDQDGVWEMWRRWDGNSGWELCFSIVDWDNFHVGGNFGFRHGGLMGRFQADQSESTDWHVDDFRLLRDSPIDEIDDGSGPVDPGDEDEDEDELPDPDFFAHEDFQSGTFNSPPSGLNWGGTIYTNIQDYFGNGNYSIRFRFKAEGDSSNNESPDSWAEQNFTLDNPHRELWMRMRLYIPTNYYHRSASPSNNKILALFMDDYSSNGDGPTVIWEMWSDGSGGSDAAVHYSPGQHQVAGGHMQETSFINTPDDRNRWMTIVFRVVAGTSRGSDNGIIEMWRRWQGEDSWTKIHEMFDADIASPPDGPDGWMRGKILGWSNSGMNEEQHLLVDDVMFGDGTLLTGVDPDDPPEPPPDEDEDEDDPPDDEDDPPPATGGGTIGTFQLPGGNFVPERIPMNIVAPRPDNERSSESRYSFAYPGIEFEVPFGVCGGSYPFRYEIVDRSGTAAVANASIGELRTYNIGRQWYGSRNYRNYGVLRWTPSSNDDGNSFSFSVRVTGQDGVTQTRTFSGVVQANKFVFVDPSVSSSGNGSINSPYRQASDLWSGGSDSSNSGKFVYFREGNVGAFSSGFITTDLPRVFMRYPGDNRPIFDGTPRDYLFGNNGINDFWFSGIEVRGTPGSSVGNVRFFEAGTSTSDADRLMLWDNKFVNGSNGSAGTSNNGWLVILDGPGTHQYITLLANECDNAPSGPNGFSFFDFYQCEDVVIEHNITEDMDSGYMFWPKQDVRRFSIRANDTWGSSGNIYPYLGREDFPSNDAEICWNYHGGQEIASWNNGIGANGAYNQSTYRNTINSLGDKVCHVFKSRSSNNDEDFYCVGNVMLSDTARHIIADNGGVFDVQGSSDSEAESFLPNSTFDNAYSQSASGYLDLTTGQLTGSGAFNYGGQYGAEPVADGLLAYDAFESGNLNYTTPGGFEWGTVNGMNVINNAQFAASGAHVLRAEYPAGSDEVRSLDFDIGGAETDVYFRYWLRIPSNWEHGSGSNDRNQLFAVWMDSYENTGPTGVVQIRGDGGDSILRPYVHNRNNTPRSEVDTGLTFATPDDQGRWMEIVIRAAMASGSSNNNGRFEMWRRWSGNSSWTECFSITDWDNFHVGGNEGWAHGRLMGTFLASQPDDTTWHIDDFTVATISLLT